MVPNAAVSGRAADEAGADGVHLEAGTIGVPLTEPYGRMVSTPARPARKAMVGIGHEIDLLGVDAGELGGLLVAAHGIEMTANGGLGGDEGVDADQASATHSSDGDALITAELMVKTMMAATMMIILPNTDTAEA